ncbi:tumor necrosis factor receptor superfamily member 4-like [Eudromia elegans]
MLKFELQKVRFLGREEPVGVERTLGTSQHLAYEPAVLTCALESAVTVAQSLGLKCKEHEYPFGEKCCKDCAPGEWMTKRCTATTETACAPCKEEFFSAEHNHNFCRSCTVCDTSKSSREVKKCEKTSDRVCACVAGYVPLNRNARRFGSLSLILICLVLLVVSGMSILLLIIQAAKKETKRRPCRNNQQGPSVRLPIQEEQIDSNSSLIKN